MVKWKSQLNLLFIISLCSYTSTQYLNASQYPNPAGAQLYLYGESHPHPPVDLSSSGAPVDDLANSLSAGQFGPLLIEDPTFFDQIQSFTRERVSPRVVHAKGAGAFGYLKITNDITRYSKAKVFSEIGKIVPVAVRFSRVNGEPGSADTARDTRGFSMKFFTPDGIWDLLCNSSPIFFMRDPLLFPDLIHSQMRNPQTHIMDPNAFWDFNTLIPESLFQIMYTFSDFGIPLSFRHINGYAINTYALVNTNGTVVYCKFQLMTNQGVKTMPVSEANTLAGLDPDYFIRDLYNAIAVGDLPSWNFSIQVMTQSQLPSFPWNPFDPTKLWPESDYPSIPIGTLVLTENPTNYFIDVESIGFSPRNMVPGIQPTVDKLLQGRLFAYRDAQTYRLGVNSPLLRINTPVPRIFNYQRDGLAQSGSNQDGAVNYYPNSFNGPITSPRDKLTSYPVSGNASRYNTANEDNFSQPTLFYESLSAQQRADLVANLAASLSTTYPMIQMRALGLFYNVSQELGQLLNISLKQANIETAYMTV